MQQFVKWGGLTPEELKARQQKEMQEYIESRMIAEAMKKQQSSLAWVGSAPAPLQAQLEFTVDTGLSEYFGMDVTVSGATTITIEWGDGTGTQTLSIAEGETSIEHTFPSQDETYSVVMSFDAPQNLTDLDFWGYD